MTTSRLALLLAVLLAGLSSIFLLPAQNVFNQPTGIDLDLPQMVGGIWYGKPLEISDREKIVLGSETEFSRRSYTNGRGDEVQASVVLGGRDMNTSIHRPEWCLPAQGWTIADSGTRTIPLGERGELVATRLSNMRFIPNPETGKPVADKEGKPIVVRNLDYYWFVGSTDVTSSHVMRNVIDWKDRLMEGHNQRWGFITVAATITDNLQKDGRTEAETDAMIVEFIKKLVPLTHKESVKFD